MDKNYKCPICNKAGIPDFINEDVVCPCCNSDLSIYRKIHLSSMNTNKNNSKRWIITTIFMFIICLFLSCCLYCIYSDSHEQICAMENNLKEKDTLIEQLKNAIKKQPKFVQKEQNGMFWYVVRPGDSFCKISKSIYGTENRYKEIIKINNLRDNAILHPGDSILIK